MDKFMLRILRIDYCLKNLRDQKLCNLKSTKNMDLTGAGTRAEEICYNVTFLPHDLYVDKKPFMSVLFNPCKM